MNPIARQSDFREKKKVVKKKKTTLAKAPTCIAEIFYATVLFFPFGCLPLWVFLLGILLFLLSPSDCSLLVFSFFGSSPVTPKALRPYAATS